jgi:hypothetical protein
LQFSPDMKKIFVLLILISFAMICSCQKQASATEAQLAQRKTELDAREKALDEREKELALGETVLRERERALKSGKAIATGPMATPAVQSLGQAQAPDAAQLKADREKRLQQLPSELRALVPDAAQIQATKDRVMKRQLDQRQLRLDELQRMRTQMQNQAGASDAARMPMNPANQPAAPGTTAAPAAVYPGADATSPSPSPTPQ